MRFLFIAILVLGTTVNAAEHPQVVVERFYTIHIAERPAGLPDGDALKKLAPFFSERLYALIVDALKYRDEMIRKHPDAKPPFVDGDPFTSVFEGPTAFEIKGADGDKVRVRFTDGPDVAWEDVVVVKEENGRWVIDDILFSGLGDFNPPGQLSKHLKSR